MSDNGVPDLGGINNEEAFFADEVCHQMGLTFFLLVPMDYVRIITISIGFLCGTIKVINWNGSLTQVQQISMVFPGAYRKVSVELKVLNFFPLLFVSFLDFVLIDIRCADP